MLGRSSLGILPKDEAITIGILVTSEPSIIVDMDLPDWNPECTEMR
jgi:hypothetical protein